MAPRRLTAAGGRWTVDVDHVLHAEHALHGVALDVIDEYLVSSRGEQDLAAAASRSRAAQRHDHALTGELLAHLLRQALQVDGAPHRPRRRRRRRAAPREEPVDAARGMQETGGRLPKRLESILT
uniref:Uncharacterized protein n=1 Tax=Oryza rufipogon TaxID=4529 RepID=A0A679BDY5_ORYRU|nr:hypothetical protein [Oryza rufipogon]BBF90032.1 hypothetical protein [Oryza rufipogon]